MKKFSVKLLSCIMVLAILSMVLPVGVFASAENTEVVTTKTWFVPADSPKDNFSDFIASYWSSKSGYQAYGYVPDSLWQISQWNGAENKKSDENYYNDWSNGGWADNMTALTINDNRFRNFELSLSIATSGVDDSVIISAREKTPGQAVSGIGSWDFGIQPDGTANIAFRYYTNETRAFISENKVNTLVNDGNVASNGAGTWNNLKMRVVGNTVETWVNDVKNSQAVTLSDNCNKSGYISVIVANQNVTLNNLTVTWLDEDGNPVEWGTVHKEVDSTRTWFGDGNSTDLSEFRASYWDADNGYLSTETAKTGNGWSTDTFWHATDWYTLEPCYDNRYGDGSFGDGSWADNMAALTLNDNSFRNFEVEVLVNGYVGHYNPIMISAREKTPGQPLARLKEWQYGTQPDLSENVVLRYFVNDTSATMTSGSNSATISGITTGEFDSYQYNTLKLRVVGNTATAWVNGTNQGTVQLGENCAASGYISIIFADVAGGINKLKVTRLGEDGKPIDYNSGKQLFIKSVEDFAKIGKNTEYPVDGNYWLANDITVDENHPWSCVSEFSGSLNGNGHTITGLTNALIYDATGNVTVKNLFLNDINIPNLGTLDKGAVIVCVKGETEICNVAVTGQINNEIGGPFVGCVDGGKLNINNCSFVGDICVAYFGGFIGRSINNSYVTINDSYSDYNITWADNSWVYAVDNAPVTVNNSYYTSNVHGTNYSSNKTFEALGLPSEYWVHDGRTPKLKITGAESYILGDVNLDKTFDLLDLIAMKKILANVPNATGSVLAANFDGNCDENGIALVEANDMAILRKRLLGIDSNYNTYSAALTGKSALFLGDSIAHGANDTAEGKPVANTILDQADKLSWCGRISAEYGLNGRNVAMSGWSLASGHNMARIVNEFNEVSNVSDYDYVILHGGVNDVWHSYGNYECGPVALGSLTGDGTTEFNTDTLYGALEELVYTAKQKAPDAKIGYIINNDVSAVISPEVRDGVINYSDMVTAIKAVCAKYETKYLDLSANTEFTAEFNNQVHLVDGVHPLSAGYDIIYKYVAKWMETL